MNAKKELEKRMLVKKTISNMNKQIEKLEAQKQVYLDACKQAKEKGLSSQYNLAVSGLKMCMLQQKKIYAMKLNFEITSQMKDMMQLTQEFLKGMGSLSKDMTKLTKEKDFNKVEKEFNQAMENAERREMEMEMFMEETETSFAQSSGGANKELEAEINTLVENSMGENTSDEVNVQEEVNELLKKLG